ncbi:MAG: hypothetical protein PHT99_03525 [Methanoregula sp.]|nr:hypothetical protein [Methanoregula sp.]
MAGSPKYLQNNEETVVLPVHSEEDARWNLFIDSRKGEGKRQAIEILNLLKKEETEFEWLWVPLTTIEKHLQESCNIGSNRLFHLLKDMENNHIIRKKIEIDSKLKTPNKERTFYKFHFQALSWIKTKEGYENAYRELHHQNSDLQRRYNSAMYVLNKHQLLNEFFKDYFGERPRSDDPTDYHDLARSVVLSMDPKFQKRVQWLIDMGYAKDEIDVVKKSLDEMKERMDKDPSSLSGPLIVRK